MTIAQVSKKYNLSADTLRYYERIGLLSSVPRNSSNIRDYDETTCKKIEFIKCMRAAGVEISILQEYMKLLNIGESTVSARKKLLEIQREKLEKKRDDIISTIDKLNYKIRIYNEIEEGIRTDFTNNKT